MDFLRAGAVLAVSAVQRVLRLILTAHSGATWFRPPLQVRTLGLKNVDFPSEVT